jgi:uncharacterized protein (DUF488 family)
MIQNEQQLEATLEQLMRMYRVLGGLHSKIEPQNDRNYQVFAQGPMDYIVRLRREIDEYLGLDEAAVLKMQRELAEFDAQRETTEQAERQSHAKTA